MLIRSFMWAASCFLMFFFVIIPLDLERSFTWPDVHKSGGRSASRDRSSFVFVVCLFFFGRFLLTKPALLLCVPAQTRFSFVSFFYFALFTTDRRLALILHYLWCNQLDRGGRLDDVFEIVAESSMFAGFFFFWLFFFCFVFFVGFRRVNFKWPQGSSRSINCPRFSSRMFQPRCIVTIDSLSLSLFAAAALRDLRWR